MRKKFLATHLIFPSIGALTAVFCLLAGCGQVSTVPLSPLYQPAVYSSFNDGTVDGWVYDYSNPMTITPMPLLSVENQTVFQGNDALQLNIPGQVVSGGVTYSLTSYSAHVQFTPSAVDLTGKSLSMWVYWKSGLVSSPSQVGAQLFLKDTSFHYANGTFTTLTPNRWTQVVYATNSPAYQTATPPDLTQVLQAGLQVAGSGSASFTTPGVIYADEFGYQ